MTRCDIYTNHNTRKDGKCVRFVTCRLQGITKKDGCIARGDV